MPHQSDVSRYSLRYTLAMSILFTELQDDMIAAIQKRDVEIANLRDLLTRCRTCGPINPYNEHANLAEEIDAAIRNSDPHGPRRAPLSALCSP